MRDFFRRVLFGVVCLFLVVAFSFVPIVDAYYTNMDASVVVGQESFSSNSANQGGSPAANTFNRPYQALMVGTKLVVSDQSNNRILIYDSLPANNNVSADVVIGQPDFVSSTANQGSVNPSANTLNSPTDLSTDGTRLFVADYGNNRVLIFNQLPTSENTSADVVIGQTSMNTKTIGLTASTLRGPASVFFDKTTGKLFTSEEDNNRVLIFNQVPTTNGASANIVLGQVNFTSGSANRGGSLAANTLSAPYGIRTHNGKLFVADPANHRMLIWNSIPIENGQAADVVIGQPNMTSASANQGGLPNANTLNGPYSYPVFEGNRLLLGDLANNRVLIYNTIPTANDASADIVLGQPSFTVNSANQGGSPTAQTLNQPVGALVVNNRLLIADGTNHRILIFNNDVKVPGISIGSSSDISGSDLLKMSGSVETGDIYQIESVEYSVNGGNWRQATAKDGDFDSNSEKFEFEFDPDENEPKDADGNDVEGYSVRIRATNNNTDRINNLFYFTPFNTDGIEEAVSGYPTFNFKVHRNQGALYESLDHYQIQVRKGDGSAATEWQMVIDNVPVNFNTRKFDIENQQRDKYSNWDTKNGEYETDEFFVSYSDDSSEINVRSKITPLSGTYQYRVVAVDKSGHHQNSNEETIYIIGNSTGIISDFPLAILDITGVGNPFLNIFNFAGAKSSYTTRSTNPTFFGIAWTGSEVKLRLIRQNCEQDCQREYITTGNEESRFGINIPKGDLVKGAKYQSILSSSKEDKYSELPAFLLKIGE